MDERRNVSEPCEKYFQEVLPEGGWIVMMLSDIRDYIAGLDMAEQCYMGKLDAKKGQ